MYSAKKVAGERLYKAARAGREVEREPVPITVHAMELLETDGQAFSVNEDGTRDFLAKVRCSSGTYVRTLAHDIGAKLGVGAHLAALRRTAVGHFSIADAVTLDELERRGTEGALGECLVSPADALKHLPAVNLDANRANRVANGREVSLTRQELAAIQEVAQPLRLLREGGELLAVGRFDAARQAVTLAVVLYPAGQAANP
jgi:tRNA pseudouridine55 synthase